MKKVGRDECPFEEEFHAPGLWAWSALIGTFSVIFLLWFFAIGTILNIREWHAQLYDDFKEFQASFFPDLDTLKNRRFRTTLNSRS